MSVASDSRDTEYPFQRQQEAVQGDVKMSGRLLSLRSKKEMVVHFLNRYG